jgi:uncharacterized secreted protein with C-terminal beta-propeller domain
MRTPVLAALMLGLLLAAPAAATTADPSAKRPRAGKVALESFGSCGALIRYGQARVRRGPGAGPPLPQPPAQQLERRVPFAEGVEAPAVQEDSARDGSSGTNVQEADVDEPDVVKAAGSRIFVVGPRRLHAIDSEGPRLLGSLTLDGHGHQLLLHGDRVLVISHDDVVGGDPGSFPEPGNAVRSDAGVTMLTEVDVSDPAAMRVVRTERLRGVHVSSRLTGRTARVVVWTRPRAAYQAALRGELRGWLPRRALRRRGLGRPTYRRAAPCRRVLRPATFSGTDVLTVLTIDLDRGLPAVDSDAIMSGGQVVYASTRSLYVATQKWTPEPDSPDAEPAGSFTTIHRFDTSDPDATSYRASGEVPGFLLNQFSLSEHDGLLRAASTDEPVWWGMGIGADESQSFVTVLDERGGALVQVGRVGDLGRRERIYAVRFVGDAAYVVTFRQVDPLYVVDLSQPQLPRVRGELKIRGYSAYLHPLGPNLLLGVGQDATERGATLGTQLSLFDVSDPSRPRRLHHSAIPGGQAGAEVDHHAFLWWAPKHLAVLPLSDYEEGFFAGAVGFRVRGSTGISELGRAAHPDGWVIERAVVVKGRLVTVSGGGIAVNDMETLAAQAWLPFPQQ